MAEVRLDGQVFSLPDDIAADDAKLRATLVSVSPAAATAEIVRAQEGDKKVVTIVKKAGTKGGAVDQVVAALGRVPTRLAPVFDLLERSTPAAFAAGVVPTDDEISGAVEAARSEQTAISVVVRDLCDSAVAASPSVPVGF
jgi:hypothetical protein